ncbi:MAG TPA: 3-oxoacyl-[acyl-carrier-protein] reductase [Chitinophagaceae bacterium]|nr:3-oxoacyl-[acyl-carrier-protein] reductase [Chitinophagaceae bacterium]
MKLLDKKVCIVTGAARGIGASIALKFGEQGATVILTYISDSSAEKAAALVTQIEAMGAVAKAYKSNAADYAQCEMLVNDVVKEFGTIDALVNNAGISKDNLLIRVTPEQWEQTMDTNLTSVFNMTKHAIRPMMKAKKGSVVNMSSMVALRGNAGQTAYSASKAGIIGFTKSLAHELGSRNIRCNAIAPGFIETDMTHYLKDGNVAADFMKRIPLHRFGKADEVADTAIFLASDMSSYVTGQVISACGGLSI